MRSLHSTFRASIPLVLLGLLCESLLSPLLCSTERFKVWGFPWTFVRTMGVVSRCWRKRLCRSGHGRNKNRLEKHDHTVLFATVLQAHASPDVAVCHTNAV
jgi:hypothetical protein